MKAIAITLLKTKDLSRKNMKANLIFNLDDYDDNFAHRRCMKALEMALAINEIEMVLRNQLKKSEDEKTIDGLILQGKIQTILDRHDINVNLLIE
jgi:hypothetical protein